MVKTMVRVLFLNIYIQTMESKIKVNAINNASISSRKDHLVTAIAVYPRHILRLTAVQLEE